MAEEYWWELQEDEIYWLEITDREDIGANLLAPQTNQKGRDFWSYSFLKLVNKGDVVFHYDKKIKSIVGKSIVENSYIESQLKWAARGSYSKSAGVKPYWRSGWEVPLENYQNNNSLSIEKIIQCKDDIKNNYLSLKSKFKTPIYFPFELGDKRPPRPMQGYLFKFPKFMLDIFPELAND